MKMTISLEWFFIAVLLILLCLAYSPLFIVVFKIFSSIFNPVIAWLKRHTQQAKEEEARRLEYQQERGKRFNEFARKRKEKRKKKIQEMLADGSLGKLNKTLGEILQASDEVLENRRVSLLTMGDMLREGINLKKIKKGKRDADEYLLIEVSIKYGIDVNLLKRIADNLEDLERAERD